MPSVVVNQGLCAKERPYGPKASRKPSSIAISTPIEATSATKGGRSRIGW